MGPRLHHVTRKVTHPTPPHEFPSRFLVDNGEKSVTAERCIYGNISTSSSPNATLFRCEYCPRCPWLGQNRLGKIIPSQDPRGVWYLACCIPGIRYYVPKYKDRLNSVLMYKGLYISDQSSIPKYIDSVPKCIGSVPNRTYVFCTVWLRFRLAVHRFFNYDVRSTAP